MTRQRLGIGRNSSSSRRTGLVWFNSRPLQALPSAARWGLATCESGLRSASERGCVMPRCACLCAGKRSSDLTYYPHQLTQDSFGRFLDAYHPLPFLQILLHPYWINFYLRFLIDSLIQSPVSHSITLFLIVPLFFFCCCFLFILRV